RRPDKARACADEMARHPGMPQGCRFAAVPSVRDAVEGADIVVTVTSSREPLVRAEWLSPGAHITAVGSDGPDKRELHTDVLRRADRIVADSRDQCLRLGEIHHAVAEGAILEHRIACAAGAVKEGLRARRSADAEL